MVKTRLEELFSELYSSSKRHDSWQRYAMLVELRNLMNQPKGSGSDQFERSGDDRRFGGGQFRGRADDDDETWIDRRFRDYLMLRNDDDDETWTWTETDLSMDEEHYSVMDDETESLEEESMPQFQVPVYDLEHGLRILNASSIVCEDSQYVVGCDELCDRQKSILQVSYVKDVEEVVNDTREPMPRISVNAVSGISDYDTMRAEEPPKSVADEVHEQPIELVVRDQAQEARSEVVSSPGVSVTRVGAMQSQPCIFGRANYVWKPGELEQCVQVQENRVQHERNKAEGVDFFVQRVGVAIEMENQTVTAMVVYDKRSDRVWEPGRLPTKLNMWDWTEQHPRQGDVFEFEADLLEEIIHQDENPERHSFLQSENFQPFHQNQVFEELEVVESKSSTNPMLGSMLKRHHKRQQVRKLKLSPKPWLFKFKQKLIRLKIRDKEFQIAMPLAPKILKVHHMLNSLVIAEAAAPIYPTVEYLCQFSSKVGIDKAHSSSSLRANQIWDPGGKFLYI